MIACSKHEPECHLHAPEIIPLRLRARGLLIRVESADSALQASPNQRTTNTRTHDFARKHSPPGLPYQPDRVVKNVRSYTNTAGARPRGLRRRSRSCRSPQQFRIYPRWKRSPHTRLAIVLTGQSISLVEKLIIYRKSISPGGLGDTVGQDHVFRHLRQPSLALEAGKVAGNTIGTKREDSKATRADSDVREQCQR